MRMSGYLEHLDLGIDPESGERNILVRTPKEFFKLNEEEQCRAWAPIKVASEILDKPAVSIYQRLYKGKVPSKIVKKNPLDRHGLALVRVFESYRDQVSRRAADTDRIVKSLSRNLKLTGWIPSQDRLLIEVQVSVRLGQIERRLRKGIEGGIESEQYRTESR